MRILGVLLILAGLAALAYGGFSFTTRKRAVDMGPLKIDKKTHHLVLIPPLLGVGGILVGGVLVFISGPKNH